MINLGFSKKTYVTILLLVSSLFISLLLSNIPFFIQLQNKGYYHKIIRDYTQYNLEVGGGGNAEGLTDISANNMIYSILTDPSANSSPFRQLTTIREIVTIANYPSANRNNIVEILDSSGNTDNTKVSKMTKFIQTYAATATT
jgi:hypothetical protein